MSKGNQVLTMIGLGFFYPLLWILIPFVLFEDNSEQEPREKGPICRNCCYWAGPDDEILDQIGCPSCQ